MYPHAAAIEIAPTAISHHDVVIASPSPATAATPNEINAALLTCAGLASPPAVIREGPMRSLSVPRIPSD